MDSRKLKEKTFHFISFILFQRLKVWKTIRVRKKLHNIKWMNYERREREVERKLGVNFINIFQATFLYESVLHSFSLVTVFPAKAIFYVCALIFYMCEGLSQVILGARTSWSHTRPSLWWCRNYKGYSENQQKTFIICGYGGFCPRQSRHNKTVGISARVLDWGYQPWWRSCQATLISLQICSMSYQQSYIYDLSTSQALVD